MLTLSLIYCTQGLSLDIKKNLISLSVKECLLLLGQKFCNAYLNLKVNKTDTLLELHISVIQSP